MINIIYSATRQWNPGDEFILMGVERLINEVLGAHNGILYNRNPQIRPDFTAIKKKKISRFFLKSLYQKLIDNKGFLDNSFKPNGLGENVDYVIFAGSPEWYGSRLAELYSIILQNNIPTIFLGLGIADKIDLAKFTSDEKKVLEKAKFISCRDEYCTQALEDFDSRFLPCPALFSSPHEKFISKVKKIGLIYGTDKAVAANNISIETDAYMKKIYAQLLEQYSGQYEFEFIAHYIDEVDQFYKDYPNGKLRYSYKSDVYVDIFKDYDLVIGHRVHGIGLCASIGIPGIMIAHDRRADTVKGFLAKMIPLGTSYDDFNIVFQETINNITQKNTDLLEYKSVVKKQYIDTLNQFLL